MAVPDPLRGQVAKAYIVAPDAHTGLGEDIQTFMKNNLGKHEYPRQVELVEELPRTPGGKVNRKALRDGAKPGTDTAVEQAGTL